ncbi:hypothetical protein GFS60_02982 [Rhodococcus sp. WAY2]|nr:hypothetical protein GFS60_02982 [Rhodococcus sp. WAY2]
MTCRLTTVAYTRAARSGKARRPVVARNRNRGGTLFGTVQMPAGRSGAAAM